MTQRITCCAVAVLFLVLSSQDVRSQEGLPLEAELRDAARISKSWGLKQVQVLRSDGQFVETTTSGVVVVGKGLPAHLQGIGTATGRTFALTFILLHEMWHVKQLELFESKDLLDQKRKPTLECQADVEASRALVLDLLNRIEDLESTTQIADTTLLIGAFRDSWGKLIGYSPSSGAMHAHLTKRQRIMALQFGFWRAYADWLDGKQGLPQQLLRVKERMQTLADVPSGAEGWSEQICHRIVGYDPLTIKFVDFVPTPIGSNLDAEAQTTAIRATNRSRQQVEISVTMLTGVYPKGEPDQFENYVFLDAASASLPLRPGESGVLGAKLKLPFGAGDKFDRFYWNMIRPGEALVSVRATGAVQRPSTCSDTWTNAEDTDQETLIDLARLGGFAKDQFEGARGQAMVILGRIVGHALTFPIRGAVNSQIFTNFASATIYEGLDKPAALAAFRRSADAMRRHCKGLPNGVREYVDKEGNPRLSVERLTVFSDAWLGISQREREAKSGGKETVYSVNWFVSHAPL